MIPEPFYAVVRSGSKMTRSHSILCGRLKRASHVVQTSPSPGNGVLLIYTKRLRKSTHTKRPFKSLGCCEGMCHMVLQRAHRKDHGLRSDARIMGHHPPDYGCPSEAGHGGLLSKGCCLSEAGHVDAQEHALGAHVHKKTPQNPTQLLASVLQPRLSNGHEPWTVAYI